MLSAADLRQALQAGMWEALADDCDRAAMRVTCRDARDMADELHDTAVLPVGPGAWHRGIAIATYHRRLGAVRSVHVVYSGGAEDEARAVHFMEAYSAALGAALPAAACSISMTPDNIVMARGRQLPTAFAAVLLQRVVPRVERLDMALDRCGNLEQLLQALEPCARLCSLRLVPVPAAEGPHMHGVRFSFANYPRVLDALCRLPRLHTLSGPWAVEVPHLQRLCDTLPCLTTLGFDWLSLTGAAGACISQRLHTLAAWRYSAGHESMRLDRPWHLSRSTSVVYGLSSLPTALPAVRHLDAVRFFTRHVEDVHEGQAAMQRCAACAERWAWKLVITDSDLQSMRGMPPGILAALRHLVVLLEFRGPAPAGMAAALGSLVSAAPNITTLAVFCIFGSSSPQMRMAMMQPFRRAVHLHTLWLSDLGTPPTAAGQAALLEGVVRCLVQPGAVGGRECCRALRHVLLAGAKPDALAACRAALDRDAICVSVGGCDLAW